MTSKYCERGHVVLGDTCSHCARRDQLAIASKVAKPSAPTSPNSTLVELRALKIMLGTGLITEAEYDERRNALLASF
ncbi:MAG: hypothetical protein JWR44_3705 [Hymenobacter sp.]|jgi:hypothetical protein|nr:hypothetical protein [Hymenobacter sp.]